jgi:predicted nucleic-acid-binding protein
MKILDTVVLIGAIREEDRLHEKAKRHLDSLTKEKDVFVPTSVLLEFDLEMKTHGYTWEERKLTWKDMLVKIPPNKVLPLTPSYFAEVPELETDLTYFDAIIVCISKEMGAKVITTDREIGSKTDTYW